MNELKKFVKDTFDEGLNGLRNEFHRDLHAGLDELRFDVRELRHDMNHRFDEQDATDNQILQVVGIRFDDNDQRLLRLEKHTA